MKLKHLLFLFLPLVMFSCSPESVQNQPLPESEPEYAPDDGSPALEGDGNAQVAALLERLGPDIAHGLGRMSPTRCSGNAGRSARALPICCR